MATYTVRAPDGKTVTLQGPAGASQADIVAQAQKLYKPQAGPNPLLQKYNDLRSSVAAKIPDPTLRARSLQNFDADPRVQRLRQAAGLAPLSTANGDVKAVARKSVQQRVADAGADIGKDATAFQSASAGISRGMFGIPERLAALGERFLPSALTGNTSDASYDNILQMIRAKDTAAINANPSAGISGEIGGSIVGGGAAGKAVMKAAGRVVASGAPPAATAVAKAIQAIGTLRKGQKLANAAKIAATGAAAGGAQAAGEGSDVPTGIATGAVAAPVLAGGLKVAQVLTRPFRDVMRLSSAGQILSRLTTATQDQLAAKAASYRAATGAEPTLFELLPLADRNKILSQAVVGKDNVVEKTSDAIRARAQNLGPEMSARAQQILQPSRTFIQNGLRRDIASARGGKLAPGDEDMIANAMESPTDMLHLRDQEANAIMAPHQETLAANSLADVLPSVPGPDGTRIDADPQISNVIRSAAGTLRSRPGDSGVSVGDITDMMSTLRADVGKGGIEGRAAQAAIDHLQSVLDTNVPEAGAAAREMADAYAARSRMAEGMKAGAQTQLRDDVQVGTSRRQARVVRNAYDTPEGNNGLTLGQGNRVQSSLAGSPEEALRATIATSRGSIGRPLEQNVGASEAEQLIAAAHAQDDSAQALSAASNKAQSGSGDGANAETLVQAIAGLHPSSFITTKASAVRKLLDMTYIPENRAKTMVDMLFSQDPKLSQKAMDAIGNEPNGATFMKYLAGTTGQLAVDANAPDNTTPPARAPLVEEPAGADEIPADAAPAPDAPPAAPEAAQAGGSPYAPILQQTYQNENPDLVNLVQHVKLQESGGDQAAVSKKGAVGVMQVEPSTGPEAAKLAGVPWDPKALKNDAAYNEILGHAYLSSLLRKYGGDVGQALAAYNAGPGRVDAALATHGGNFLTALPTETQDYVAKVGG